MEKLITAKDAYKKSYGESSILYCKTDNIGVFEKLVGFEESFITSMNKLIKSACEKEGYCIAFDYQFKRECINMLLNAGYDISYNYGKELTFVSWEKPL